MAGPEHHRVELVVQRAAEIVITSNSNPVGNANSKRRSRDLLLRASTNSAPPPRETCREADRPTRAGQSLAQAREAAETGEVRRNRQRPPSLPRAALGRQTDDSPSGQQRLLTRESGERERQGEPARFVWHTGTGCRLSCSSDSSQPAGRRSSRYCFVGDWGSPRVASGRRWRCRRLDVLERWAVLGSNQ